MTVLFSVHVEVPLECRMAVRLGASLLKKVVDGLAPSLSSILVKEKEVRNVCSRHCCTPFMTEMSVLKCVLILFTSRCHLECLAILSR